MTSSLGRTTPDSRPTGADPAPGARGRAGADPAEELLRLGGQVLAVMAEEDPLADTLRTHPQALGRLPDPGPQATGALRERAAALARATLPVAGEPERDRVERAAVHEQALGVRTRLDAALVEHTMVGYDHSALGRVLGALAESRPADEEQEDAFLQQLAGVPAYLEAAADRHRAAVASGRPPVGERARRAIARIDDHLAGAAPGPLAAVPVRGALHPRRERLLRGVDDALAAYRDVLAREIAPHGRDDARAGLCWLPGGEATYAALVRLHTTVQRPARDLHDLGHQLVARLEHEYSRLGAEALGLRDAAGVRRALRDDPALRWPDERAPVEAARAALHRARGAAGEWFGSLTDRPCTVEPTRDPDAASAYYLPPTQPAGAGRYVVNVRDATDRPAFLAEVTAFHEGVPGHHLQFSRALDAEGLSPLRRACSVTAYVEGWGLYAERLADRMGLYSTPLARLGMTAMDSLRAARLVVDTGLHALGWSTERAVGYLTRTTLCTRSAAVAEVNRYVEFPGQALAYMVGRLELDRLHGLAVAAPRAASGPGAAASGVAGFHDLVLAQGPVPLGVLACVVENWIARDNH